MSPNLVSALSSVADIHWNGNIKYGRIRMPSGNCGCYARFTSPNGNPYVDGAITSVIKPIYIIDCFIIDCEKECISFWFVIKQSANLYLGTCILTIDYKILIFNFLSLFRVRS
jgi:hypothetical protein